jgi:NAD(P)H-hydrate epimerase
MILSVAEMQELERDVIKARATTEALMEEAGALVAEAVQQYFPRPGTALVYFGKGHNGGDALVAARQLAQSGWEVQLRAAYDEQHFSELTLKKFREARTRVRFASHIVSIERRHPVVALDGLLGLGAKNPLISPITELAQQINNLRGSLGVHVFAIDLPTGLDGDTGKADPRCVEADTTLTIGFPKRGLLADSATNFVGRLMTLPLRDFSDAPFSPEDNAEITTSENLLPLFAHRAFDSHKGDYGRVAVVAGSAGLTGAAVMTAEGALRAGAGLVTLFVTPDIYPILAASAPPEVMVRPVASYEEVLGEKFDVIAIGPGLGKNRAAEVLQVIRKFPGPMIVDADALNILSTNASVLLECAGKRLLTPHPGEMARLFATVSLSRAEIVKAFTKQFPVTLLLKGARTIVGENGMPLSYNTTGLPGMATGGMGDVLTGVCAGLVAQRFGLYDAARAAAWLCGRAAELAVFRGACSQESLLATDLFPHVGEAFTQLRSLCF